MLTAAWWTDQKLQQIKTERQQKLFEGTLHFLKSLKAEQLQVFSDNQTKKNLHFIDAINVIREEYSLYSK